VFRRIDSDQAFANLLSLVELAAMAMQRGVPVVLLDDQEREDEADLVVAASRITVSTMALIIRECSGIVCLCLDLSYVDRLQLPQMVDQNGAQNRTAFTVSIDARRGISTGVSAHDRVETMQAAIAKDARPEDLVRPGHVFPLRAESGGVLRRRGHTEGAVDLASIAGLEPAAVLCELMNADGSMARGLAVTSFAGRHRFPILSIDEIVSYREQHDIRPC
jgi:3,4-dihydroxy 2-butanone 4-phosphate synthase